MTIVVDNEPGRPVTRNIWVPDENTRSIGKGISCSVLANSRAQFSVAEIYKMGILDKRKLMTIQHFSGRAGGNHCLFISIRGACWPGTTGRSGGNLIVYQQQVHLATKCCLQSETAPSSLAARAAGESVAACTLLHISILQCK